MSQSKFAEEDEAFAFAVASQRDRRNLSQRDRRDRQSRDGKINRPRHDGEIDWRISEGRRAEALK
jgi:hypothetical protein